MINKGFLTVSFSGLCERLNYYGLQSLLVLYLVNGFSLTIKDSYVVYSSYASLAFASCIVGGVIADKWMTHYLSVFFGLVLILFGNAILIFFPTLSFFYVGATFMILGVGLIKPGSSCLVGLLNQEDFQEKDKWFLYFYTISTMGAIIGPIVYGLGMAFHEYRIGFLFGELIVCANLVLNVLSLRYFKQLEIKKTFNSYYAIAISLLMAIIVYGVLSRVILLDWVLAIAVLVCVALLFQMLKSIQTQDRKYFYSLIIPLIASVVYFALLLQIYSSITIFAQQVIHVSFWGLKIPVTWYSAIQPIFLLIITPSINALWKWSDKKYRHICEYSRIIFGLFATAFAFVCFALSAYFTSVLLLILANLFLAIAELFVIPTSIQLISLYSPAKYKGALMGGYYFLLSLSGYLSGLVAKRAPLNFTQTPSLAFTRFFLDVGLVVLGVGLILFLIKPAFAIIKRTA